MTSTASPTHTDPTRTASLPARWMVCTTAALSAGLPVPGGRQPVGVRHARGMGSLTTRCGRYAVTWVNFYTKAFEPGHPEACPQCRELMYADHSDR